MRINLLIAFEVDIFRIRLQLINKKYKIKSIYIGMQQYYKSYLFLCVFS